MKTENYFYSFFIVIALLFWNPLSFYLLYSNTPVITIKVIWIIYILIFTIGSALVWLINKNKLKKGLKNIILSCTLLFIFLGTLFSINLTIGYDTKNRIVTHEEGLIYPKNITASIKTIEFDFTSITNSLGIRDKEINIDKGDKFRILCFGDSWTMGYGVNIENSYPRKLQDYLLDKGYENVEVINCGKGGEYTTSYLKYMNKTIPLLKPNLVLVGVLQIDDLSQLYKSNDQSNNIDYNTKPSFKDKLNYVFKTYIENSIGNILKKTSKKSIKSIDFSNNYINSVKLKLERFDIPQKKQYEVLSDSVKYMFETGNLNPSYLNPYVSFTYRNIVFNNPSHDATKIAINIMDKDIKSMKKLCDQDNAKLVFVNMPTSLFTGHKVMRTPDDIFDKYYVENNHIDSIYQNIAMQNNLSYIELTNHFIDLYPKDQYYFKFDGHPNKNGYAEIAKYVGAQLIKEKIIK